MATVLVLGSRAIEPHRIAQLARELGHDARVCASSRELLGRGITVLIAELRTSFDLLLLSRGTRVIYVSVDASVGDYKRAMAEGAADILVQPFSKDDLQVALQKALGKTDGAKSIIHQLSLTDLLQIMHMSRRSVGVKVSPGNGRIHISGGQIVHATHYDLVGVSALRSMLSIEATTLETEPATDVVPTIDAPFEMLLLDLMRQIDEGHRDDELEIVREEVLPVATTAEAAPRSELSFAVILLIAIALTAMLVVVSKLHRADLSTVARPLALVRK